MPTDTVKDKTIATLRHLQKNPPTTKKKEDFRDVAVVNDEKAKTITLPGRMEPLEGAEWLKKFDEQQNTEVALYLPVEGAFPLDGLVNFYRTLKEVYGWTCLEPTPTFFGEKPPHLLEVEIGHGETVQVHWGNVSIPGVKGVLTTGYKQDGNRVYFCLQGKVRRRDEPVIKSLMELVRQQVRENSIYRGKAVRVNFRDEDGDIKDFNILDAPKFMDVTQVDPQQLIFPENTQKLFAGTLLLPVRRSEECRKSGVPLKRGILLEGPFGVGKTLAAQVTAKTCEDNGWTFIYLEDCRDLDRGLAMAKMYAPAVLFAEDIDRATGGDRDSDMDRILNILDGINTKDSEIITVLTTNNVEAINKAMVRPGRIDSVIPVRAPDIAAAIRLIRRYGAGLVDATDEALAIAIKPLLGNNAAVIREAVERSKMFSIDRDTDEDGNLRIEAQDIAMAAETMEHHLKLLNKEPAVPVDAMEVFGEAVGTAVGRCLADSKHLSGAEGVTLD